MHSWMRHQGYEVDEPENANDAEKAQQERLHSFSFISAWTASMRCSSYSSCLRCAASCSSDKVMNSDIASAASIDSARLVMPKSGSKPKYLWPISAAATNSVSATKKNLARSRLYRVAKREVATGRHR